MERKDELRESVSGVVKELCEVFRGENPPIRQWVRIVKEGAGRISFPAEEKIDFSGYSMRIYKLLEKSPNAHEISQKMRIFPEV